MAAHILNCFKRSLRYRCGRFYNSFFYAQSNNKYVMLVLFPGIIWYTRFRADTKLGYRCYIAPTAGGPVDYENMIDPDSLKPSQNDANERKLGFMDFLNRFDDAITNACNRLWGVTPYHKWKNGAKVYMDDNATVQDIKKYVYGSEFSNFSDVLVSCKGRIMQDQDNLALATRAFCKRDPRLVLWRDPKNLVETARPLVS